VRAVGVEHLGLALLRAEEDEVLAQARHALHALGRQVVRVAQLVPARRRLSETNIRACVCACVRARRAYQPLG
jgi:hypothetical protein